MTTSIGFWLCYVFGLAAYLYFSRVYAHKKKGTGFWYSDCLPIPIRNKICLSSACGCISVVMAGFCGSSSKAQAGTLLQNTPFVPVPKGYLSWFWNRDSAAGTKALEVFLSRVVEPGQNVPCAKKSLCPAGLEPKTYCLAHLNIVKMVCSLSLVNTDVVQCHQHTYFTVSSA